LPVVVVVVSTPSIRQQQEMAVLAAEGTESAPMMVQGLLLAKLEPLQQAAAEEVLALRPVLVMFPRAAPVAPE
jgi:hypothetical protein